MPKPITEIFVSKPRPGRASSNQLEGHSTRLSDHEWFDGKPSPHDNDVTAIALMSVCMASLTIRNLDELTKRRLHLRAAKHSLSMEEEAQRLLKERLGSTVPSKLGAAPARPIRGVGRRRVCASPTPNAAQAPTVGQPGMILLDTNVLSEFMRSRPSAKVVAWLDEQTAERVFTSAVSRAEIELGLALMPKSRRQEVLREATRSMLEEDFAG